MSSHLTGSHRRSADNNSRERNPRNAMSSNNSNNNAADYTSGGGGHSRTRGQHSNENQVKEAIIDLYLKVKIRSKDEVSRAKLYPRGPHLAYRAPK